MTQGFRGPGTAPEAVGQQKDEAVVELMVEGTQGLFFT